MQIIVGCSILLFGLLRFITQVKRLNALDDE
jgi:hypothetical protein